MSRSALKLAMISGLWLSATNPSHASGGSRPRQPLLQRADVKALKSKPRGLAESIARRRSRNVDFRESLKAIHSVPSALLTLPPPTRLSEQEQRHVHGIYDRVKATMLANGGYDDEAISFTIVGAAGRVKNAAAFNGRIYLNENEIIAYREFVARQPGIPQADVDALTDSMVASVIGHEMAHNWRHDTERVEEIRKPGQLRGREHAADKVGDLLTMASGFRPEGVLLGAQYYAAYAAKLGIKGKQRNHPDPVQRLEKAYRRVTEHLALTKTKPLMPLQTPAAFVATLTYETR